jgi:hypothetical protein
MGQALDEKFAGTWSVMDLQDLTKFADRFAELIVKECVAICQDVDGEDNIDAKSGRQDCAVEIREHFGVEE